MSTCQHGEYETDAFVRKLKEHVLTLWPNYAITEAGYSSIVKQENLMRFDIEDVCNEISRHYGALGRDKSKPNWSVICSGLLMVKAIEGDPIVAFSFQCKKVWSKAAKESMTPQPRFDNVFDWNEEDCWDEWIRVCTWNALHRSSADEPCKLPHRENELDTPCGLTKGRCEAQRMEVKQVNDMLDRYRRLEMSPPIWLKPKGMFGFVEVAAESKPTPPSVIKEKKVQDAREKAEQWDIHNANIEKLRGRIQAERKPKKPLPAPKPSEKLFPDQEIPF